MANLDTVDQAFEGEKGFKMKLLSMASAIRWKKNWLLLLVVAVFLFLVYTITQLGVSDKFPGIPLMQIDDHPKSNQIYNVWPQFQVIPSMGSAKFRASCVTQQDFSITGLADVQKQWAKTKNSQCQVLYDKFTSIFTIDARKAELKLPEPFKEKVKGWLGGNEELFKEVYNQDVIHVISEFTREHTIFNPIRDKRPISLPDKPEDIYFDEVLKKTAENCDFCKYKNYTAEHVFGRIESAHSFTASNVFKVDTLHALIAPKKHDPIHWTLEEFLDLFHLVQTWLQKAHVHHPSTRFPALLWDVLPKCGASQVHPHLHVMFDPDRYHGEVESWRRGAQDYFLGHRSNYYSDLVEVYSALNLTVTYGNAVAFASLAPKKDHEVVVMAKEAGEDFHKLLYAVLRTFIDDLHKMCFSMGMGLPSVKTSEGQIPAYARIITRGFVTDLRADMSSLELFLAANVNTDPYKTIELIRGSLKTKLK